MSRSTRSTISPARPRRSTTSTTRSRRPRPACMAPSTCSAWPSGCSAKILQASTSEVYGDPTVHPQPESYWGNVNPIGPRACYDEGKRCAETLFFDYHRQHKLRIKVARIFNTYGPRMHPNDGRVVSNFIVQALQGRADHHLRRWHADPLVLLRRRPDRRLAAPDGPHARRLHGTGQPRQPGRDADPPTCREDPGEGQRQVEADFRSRCRSTIRCSAARTSALAREKLKWEPKVALDQGLAKRSPTSTPC